MLCIHQADETEKTEFLKTLAVYLSCERNITHAAKELFIHRNTLIYRLKKINEMLTADLDDPYTRDYIRFSIYIVRILTGQNSLKKVKNPQQTVIPCLPGFLFSRFSFPVCYCTKIPFNFLMFWLPLTYLPIHQNSTIDYR